MALSCTNWRQIGFGLAKLLKKGNKILVSIQIAKEKYSSWNFKTIILRCQQLASRLVFRYYPVSGIQMTQNVLRELWCSDKAMNLQQRMPSSNPLCTSRLTQAFSILIRLFKLLLSSDHRGDFGNPTTSFRRSCERWNCS